MRAAAQKPALGQRDGGLLRSALLRPQGPPLESTPTLSSSLSLLSQRSSFRLGWPAARGGAAVVLTVHEAGPAARASCASGRSEAARWRAGGPDRGGLAVSSPVEALMLCGATACWLGLHSLSQTLCCREAGSNEWCEGWVVRGQRRKASFYQSRDAKCAPDRALARSRPRGGRGSFRRHAAHQARIGPCRASSVGIRRARARPTRTNWRHAA